MALTAWLLSNKLFNSIHETSEALENLVRRGAVADEISNRQLENKCSIQIELILIRINSMMEKNCLDDTGHGVCEFIRLDVSNHSDTTIGCDEEMIHERKREFIDIVIDLNMRNTGAFLLGFLDDFLVAVRHPVLNFIRAAGQNIVNVLIAIRLADVVLDRLVETLLAIVLRYVGSFRFRLSHQTAIC